MQYGLIGEKLGHSYSKEIHTAFGKYNYELKELSKDEVKDFILEKQFKGLNVTIPYKETVMEYLDFIDDEAKAIGAVNTVVNRDGKLYGYNTDFYGMLEVLKDTGFDFKDKKVLVLGVGATAKTATAVLNHLQVKDIFYAARNKSKSFCIDKTVSFTEAKETLTDVDFIVNTTPCGMYPNLDDKAIDLSPFKNIYGVFDVIFNPGRTQLMLQAESLNKKAFGGLKMLVYQAVYATEKFTGESVERKLSERILKDLRSKNENIVLIGMPASGKSTVGKLLSKDLSKEFFDTDNLIVKKAGCEITDIFANKGETYFRDLESEVIKEISLKKNVIIATGGGAVLRKENVEALKAYGRLYFIDRALENLLPTEDRPLANDAEKIKKLYETRLPIYKEAADVVVECDNILEHKVEKIKRDHYEH